MDSRSKYWLEFCKATCWILFYLLLYALRQALKEHEDLGFAITPRKSRRIGPVTLSDLDFADAIALLSDNTIEAHQELLSRFDSECEKVGLNLNAKKTEYMCTTLGIMLR